MALKEQELKPCGKSKSTTIAAKSLRGTSRTRRDSAISESAERTTSLLLTYSAEDSPASHLVAPDHERAREIIATSGRKCYESYLLFGRPGSWQRTFMASCLCETAQFSTRFTHRWSLKVTKHSRRSFFQLRPLARDIGEIEFGLLPTPRANKWGLPDSHGNTDAWRMLPTPVAHDDNKSPRAHLAMKARMKGGPRKAITSLNVLAKAGMIPTPSVHGNHNRKGASQNSGNGLSTFAKLLATPQARDFRTGQAERWANPSRSRNLNDQAGEKLSVIFVEWLMGYPSGWTALEDSETPSSRKSRNGSGKG